MKWFKKTRNISEMNLMELDEAIKSNRLLLKIFALMMCIVFAFTVAVDILTLQKITDQTMIITMLMIGVTALQLFVVYISETEKRFRLLEIKKDV